MIIKKNLYNEYTVVIYKYSFVHEHPHLIPVIQLHNIHLENKNLFKAHKIPPHHTNFQP